MLDGHVINVDGSKTNDFSFKKIDFDLTKYTSKSTSYPKIQELNNSILIKCLYYYLHDGELNIIINDISTQF